MTRQYASVMKMGVVYMSVIHIVRHFKEELAWPADKQLWIISNLILFKQYITKELKNNANLSQNNIDVLLIVTTE